jgi:colanic acid/amylovoran biosynthesis glycosyltransferase
LPQVVTFYGYDVTRVPESSAEWRRRYQELFEHAALILCEGPHMREALLRQGAAAQKVRVHHLGVDLRRFAFGDRIWSGSGPIKVLVAAAFREKKGIPYALRAVAAARKARPDLDFSVTIVGDSTNDPDSQREKVEVLAAAGLLPADRLSILGFRPHQELLELAREHHVFLSPSVRAADGDTEGGAPVALIELGALGLPIVSTTHCDIPNVLGGDAQAWLAPERDADALATRLLALVSDPGRARRVTAEVRADLERRFDASRQGLALADLYREVSLNLPRAQLGFRAVQLADRAARWLRDQLLTINVRG